MGFISYGDEEPFAGIGSIARENIDVLRMQAKRTMVATGSLRRRNLFEAMLAGEGIVDF